MLKRILSVVLSVCMIVQLMPATTYAAPYDAETIAQIADEEPAVEEATASDNSDEGGETDQNDLLEEPTAQDPIADETETGDLAGSDEDTSVPAEDTNAEVPEDETSSEENAVPDEETVSDEQTIEDTVEVPVEEIPEEKVDLGNMIVGGDNGTLLTLTLDSPVQVSDVNRNVGQWIQFTAPETAYYDFESYDKTGDPYGYVYSVKKEQSDYCIASNDDGAGSRNFKLSEILITEGTTVYILASDLHDNNESYFVKATKNRDAEETYKEVTMDTPAEIDTDSSTYYTFAVPEDGMYRFYLTDKSNESANGYIYLYTASLDSYSKYDSGSNPSVYRYIYPGQRCMLRAYMTDGTAKLNVEKINIPELSLDTEVAVSSIDSKMGNWYRFTAEESEYYYFGMSSTYNRYMYFYTDPNSSYINNCSGTNTGKQLYLESGETIFVQMKSYSSGAEGTLKVEKDTATEMVVGNTYDVSATYSYDRKKCFSLNVPESGRYHLFTQEHSGKHVGVYVENVTTSETVASTSSYSAVSLDVYLEADNTYYINTYTNDSKEYQIGIKEISKDALEIDEEVTCQWTDNLDTKWFHTTITEPGIYKIYTKDASNAEVTYDLAYYKSGYNYVVDSGTSDLYIVKSDNEEVSYDISIKPGQLSSVTLGFQKIVPETLVQGEAVTKEYTEDVWYQFTPTESGWYQMTDTNTSDYIEIICYSDYESYSSFYNTYSEAHKYVQYLNKETTYQFKVHTTGEHSLTLDRLQATALTQDTEETLTNIGTNSNTAKWYSFTAPTAGKYTFSLESENYYYLYLFDDRSQYYLASQYGTTFDVSKELGAGQKIFIKVLANSATNTGTLKITGESFGTVTDGSSYNVTNVDTYKELAASETGVYRITLNQDATNSWNVYVYENLSGNSIKSGYIYSESGCMDVLVTQGTPLYIKTYSYTTGVEATISISKVSSAMSLDQNISVTNTTSSKPAYFTYTPDEDGLYGFTGKFESGSGYLYPYKQADFNRGNSLGNYYFYTTEQTGYYYLTAGTPYVFMFYGYDTSYVATVKLGKEQVTALGLNDVQNITFEDSTSRWYSFTAAEAGTYTIKGNNLNNCRVYYNVTSGMNNYSTIYGTRYSIDLEKDQLIYILVKGNSGFNKTLSIIKRGSNGKAPIELNGNGSANINNLDPDQWQEITLTPSADGIYQLTSDESTYASVELYKMEAEELVKKATFSGESTFYLAGKKDEKIYIRACSNGTSEDISYKLSVKKLLDASAFVPDLETTPSTIAYSMDVDTSMIDARVYVDIYAKEHGTEDAYKYIDGISGYKRLNGSSYMDSINGSRLKSNTDYDIKAQVYVDNSANFVFESVSTVKTADITYSETQYTVGNYKIAMDLIPIFGGAEIITKVTSETEITNPSIKLSLRKKGSETWDEVETNVCTLNTDYSWGQLTDLFISSEYELQFTIGSDNSDPIPFTTTGISEKLDIPVTVGYTHVVLDYSKLNNLGLEYSIDKMQVEGTVEDAPVTSYLNEQNSDDDYVSYTLSNSNITKAQDAVLKVRLNKGDRFGFTNVAALTFKDVSAIEATADVTKATYDDMNFKVSIPATIKNVPANADLYAIADTSVSAEYAFTKIEGENVTLNLYNANAGDKGNLKVTVYEKDFLGLVANDEDYVMVKSESVKADGEFTIPNSSREATTGTAVAGLTDVEIPVSVTRSSANERYRAQLYVDGSYRIRTNLEGSTELKGTLIYEQLNPATEYTYRIKLQKYNSSNSSWYCVKAFDESKITTKAPADLKVSLKAEKTYVAGVELSATFDVKMSASMATFYYQKDGEDAWSLAGYGTLSEDKKTITKMITGLTPNTKYKWKVVVSGVEFSDGKLAGTAEDKYKEFTTKTVAFIKNLCKSGSFVSDVQYNSVDMSMSFTEVDPTVSIEYVLTLGEVKESVSANLSAAIKQLDESYLLKRTINSLIAGTEYDYTVIGKVATSEDTVEIAKGKLTTKLPGMSVETTTHPYQAELKTYSENITEVSGAEVVLVYTKDTEYDAKKTLTDTEMTTLLSTEGYGSQSIYTYNYSMNTYTKKASYEFEIGNLLAATTYKYSIYLASGGRYVSMTNGTFKTAAMVDASKYTVDILKENVGYAYANINAKFDASLELVSGMTEGDAPQPLYEAGYDLSYKDKAGETVTSNNAATFDISTHTMSITVQKAEGSSNYKLTPYITVKAGEKGTATKVSGKEMAITFKSLKDVTATSEAVIYEMGTSKPTMIVEGTVEPTYKIPDANGGSTDGLTASIKYWVDGEEEATALTRSVNVVNGEYTASISPDYNTKYNVKVTIVPSTLNGDEKVLDTMKVSMGDNYVDASVSAQGTDSALALLKTKNRAVNSGVKFALVKKSDNVDLSKGAAEFSTNFTANMRTLSYTEVGNLVSETARLSKAVITGLDPETEYVYAFATMGTEGYEYRTGGTFTTAKALTESKVAIAATAEPYYYSAALTAVVSNPLEEGIAEIGYEYKLADADQWTAVDAYGSYDEVTEKYNVTLRNFSAEGTVIVRPYVKAAGFDVVYGTEKTVKLLSLSSIGDVLHCYEQWIWADAARLSVEMEDNYDTAIYKDLFDRDLYIHYQWKKSADAAYDNANKGVYTGSDMYRTFEGLEQNTEYTFKFTLANTNVLDAEGTGVICTREVQLKTEQFAIEHITVPYLTKAAVYGNLTNAYGSGYDYNIQLSYKATDAKDTDEVQKVVITAADYTTGYTLSNLEVNKTYNLKAELFTEAVYDAEKVLASYEATFTTGDTGTYMEFYDITDDSAKMLGVIAPVYNQDGSFKVDIRYRVKGANEWNTLTNAATINKSNYSFKTTLNGLESGKVYEVEVDVKAGAEIIDTVKDLSFETLAEVVAKEPKLVGGSMTEDESARRTDALGLEVTYDVNDNGTNEPITVSVYKGDTLVTSDTYYYDDYGIRYDENGFVGCSYYTYVSLNGLEAGTTYTVKASINLTGEKDEEIATGTFKTADNAEYKLSEIIPDENLRAILTKKFSIVDDKITLSEIEKIKNLTISDTDLSETVLPVKDVTGLDIFKYLERVSITKQDITNADVFGNITTLTELNLSYNLIEEIPDLHKCTALDDLRLNYNMIPRADCVDVGKNRKISHIDNISISGSSQRTQDSFNAHVSGTVYTTIKGLNPEYHIYVGGLRYERRYHVLATVDGVEKINRNTDFLSGFWSYIREEIAVGQHALKVVITPLDVFNKEEVRTLEYTMTAREPVAFEDPVFEAAVKAACEVNDCSLQDLDTLTLVKGEEDPAITSIEGIQYLDGLSYLTIKGHDITDLTPLEEMRSLSSLDVSYNKVTTLPNLERFPLTTLNYMWNYIDPTEFSVNNYRIPTAFRVNNSAWLRKQAACQRSTEDQDRILLQVEDQLVAVGDKLIESFEAYGLPSGSHTLVITEGAKEIATTASGNYTEADGFVYHKFTFADLPLTEGEHELTFTVDETEVVTKKVTVMKNVIKDENLKAYLDDNYSTTPATKITSLNLNGRNVTAPVTTLEGISYLKGLENVYIRGQELTNDASCALDELKELPLLSVLDLKDNNLTETVGVDSSVITVYDGNCIEGLRGQRTVVFKALDTYYMAGDMTPIYVEVSGLRKNTFAAYRTYQAQILEGEKTVATLATYTDSKVHGFYADDLELAAGEHTLTIEVYDNLGTLAVKEDFTVNYEEDTLVEGYMCEDDNYEATLLDIYTEAADVGNEKLISVAIYNDKDELVAEATPEEVSAFVSGTATVKSYDMAAFDYLDWKDFLPSTTKRYFSGQLNANRILDFGTYVVKYETNVRNFEMTVRYGRDADRSVSDVYIDRHCDNSGKYIYVGLEGYGFLPDKVTPVLYSKNGVELTKLVSFEEYSHDYDAQEYVVYCLEKQYPDIWSQDTMEDSLFTVGNSIAYKLSVASDYKLTNESATVGYVSYYGTPVQGIVYNQNTKTIDVYVEECLSGTSIRVNVDGRNYYPVVHNKMASVDASQMSTGYKSVQIYANGYTTNGSVYVYGGNSFSPYAGEYANISTETGFEEGIMEVPYVVEASAKQYTEDDIFDVMLYGTNGIAEQKVKMSMVDNLLEGQGALSLEVPLTAGYYSLKFRVYNEETHAYNQIADASFAVYVKDKMYVSSYHIYEYSKSLTLSTPNTASFDKSLLTVKVTDAYTKETKEVDVSQIDMYVFDNLVELYLQNVLPEASSAWVDVEYNGNELYSLQNPEQTFYRRAEGDEVDREYGFYFNLSNYVYALGSYGYITGYEVAGGSQLPVTVEINEPVTGKKLKKFTCNEAKHYFTKSELAGLDFSKTYEIVISDSRNLTRNAVGILKVVNGVTPSSISLDHTSLHLNYRWMDTQALNVKAVGGGNEVIWYTDNASVATVSVDGVVTARSVGKAQIVAVSIYDYKVMATCDVIVDGFSFAPVTRTLAPGETTQLKASYATYNDESGMVEYTDVTEQVVWTAMTPALATVDNTGLVTAKSTGSSLFKAVYNDLIYYDGVEVASSISGVVLGSPYNGTYPAIDNAGTYQIKQYAKYTLSPRIASQQDDIRYYKYYFESSDSDVAAVDRYDGTLVAVGPGEADITITLIDGMNTYTDTIHVGVLKSVGTTEKVSTALYDDISLLANGMKAVTLADVSLSEGWSFVDPLTTKIPTNVSYWFDVVFEKEGYYPAYDSVNVFVGEAAEEFDVVEKNNRNVITKTADGMAGGLELTALWTFDSASNYYYEVTADAGLEVSHYISNGSCKISVNATPDCSLGEHSITIDKVYYELYMNSDEVSDDFGREYTVSKTMKFQVVEGNVVDKVVLYYGYSYDNGQTIEKRTTPYAEGSVLSVSIGKNRYLYLEAYDQWGELIENPSLTVETTDKKVATASLKNDLITVANKEKGYSQLIIHAKDTGKYEAKFVIYGLNSTPVVEGSKATINTEVDYETAEGLELATVITTIATESGIYGEPTIVTGNDDTAALSDKFRLQCISGTAFQKADYAVVPMEGKEITKADAGKYYIRVFNTSHEVNYYPLTISVVTKAPTVTVKQTSKYNLFYKDAWAELSVSVKENDYEPYIEWSKEPEVNYDEAGFMVDNNSWDAVAGKTGITYYYPISANLLPVNEKNKLTDTSLTTGTLDVYVPGYKNPVKKTLKIGTVYKAPTYTLFSNESMVKGTNNVVMCADLGVTENSMYVMAKDPVGATAELKKNFLVAKDGSGLYDFDYVTWNNKDTEIETYDGQSYLDARYLGKKSATVALVFHNDRWRGTVTTKLKIKVVKPSLTLSKSTIVLNKQVPYGAYNINASTDLIIKGFGEIEPAFVDVAGDAKSQPLVDNNVILIDNDVSGRIYVTLNEKANISTGTYKFKVTPWNLNSAGEAVALKAANLTIKVVDTPVTATASLSGKLDLVKGKGYTDALVTKNYIKVTPKLKNEVTGDYVVGADINGAYSNEFRIGWYNNQMILYLADSGNEALRAKEAYKLSITYILASGMTVTTNDITIKPIQSVPKVKASAKTLNLYTSAYYRGKGKNITFNVPKGYEIDYVEMLPIDGIGTSWVSNTGTEYTLEVYVLGGYQQYLKAALKGAKTKATFKIHLVGEDGVSKCATSTVTLNVMR